MVLTPTHLAAIDTEPPNDNGRSLLAGLSRYGREAGLDKPHRMAMFLAQVAHESGGFDYDEEIASGRAYEGRADLGNTHPGDGPRFKGRTSMMLTGRDNYRRFSAWCAERFPDAPDFEAHPDLVNSDPWEGIVPIWYWVTRGLNSYADRGDFEMVTRRVNGGLNGYDDRLRWYVRAALVLLGRHAEDIRGFQEAAGLAVDGIAGPHTRGALHAALARAPGLAGHTYGAKADQERHTVAQTTTARASVAQIAAGAGTAVGGVMQLEGNAQIVAIGLGAMIVMLGMVIFRERLNHWLAGVR